MCNNNKNVQDLTQEELEEMHFEHTLELAYITRSITDLQIQIHSIHAHLLEMDEEIENREKQNKLKLIQCN